jgi:hypothetical protein
MAWIDTGLSGISFKCGGAFNNLLYIKNDNNDWRHVDYNDGSRWRHTMLMPNSDNNVEPAADCSVDIQWQWSEQLIFLEHIEESLANLATGLHKKDDFVTLRCEGSACGEIQARVLNRPSPNEPKALEVTNNSSRKVKLEWRTWLLGCSGWWNETIDPGEHRIIKFHVSQHGVCLPIRANLL